MSETDKNIQGKKQKVYILSIISLISSILVFLLFCFFCITSIVVSLRTNPFDPKTILLSRTAAVLVGTVGFVFGYSRIVNVSVGLPAIAVFVLGTIIFIWIRHYAY